MAIAARRMILELDPGSEPLSGRIAPQGESGWQFTGYVQLIEILERECGQGWAGERSGPTPAASQEGNAA